MNATDVHCPEAADESTVVIPVPGNYFLILLLICLSGLFSGLTLGLLSLDKMGLQIVIGGGDPLLAKFARAIIPVRARGNQLLCTLLLGNVAVNSLLSILMADMTSGLVGFFSSTILIVIFGEIVPQASCSRHALFIGYYTLYVTKFFMVMLSPMAYPLGYILDWALGEDLGTIHNKNELKSLLQLHVKHGAVDVESGNMLHGALKYKDMTVAEIMTPASEAFMISLSDTLNYALMTKIFRAGYSRIPVYDNGKDDIVGIMLSKDLMLIDPKDATPVRNFMTLFGRVPIIVWSDHKLGDMLNVFKQGGGHIAIVRDVNNAGPGDPFYECRGIVTLEDIVEEIIGQEINDELDSDEENPCAESADRNRDRDLALLDLLNGKMEEDKLSLEEVQAVSSHLMNNVPQFEDTCKLVSRGSIVDSSDVQMVLSQAKVIVAERKSTDSMLAHRDPAPADVLYNISVPSNRCILIMTGKVVVYAGHDQFRSELGPWSLIGLDALRTPEDSFSPDFTAYVLSDSIRFLVLTKETFVVQPGSPLPRKRSKGKIAYGFGKSKPMKTSKAVPPSATRPAPSGGDDVVSPMWAVTSSNTPSQRGSEANGGFEMSSRPGGGGGAVRQQYERIGVGVADEGSDRGSDDMDLLALNSDHGNEDIV